MAMVLVGTSDLASQESTDTAEGLFVEVQKLVASVSEPYDRTEIQTLLDAQTILDRIVSEFSFSDLAVRILDGDTIDGVDIGQLDADIAALPYRSDFDSFIKEFESRNPEGSPEGTSIANDVKPPNQIETNIAPFSQATAAPAKSDPSEPFRTDLSGETITPTSGHPVLNRLSTCYAGAIHQGNGADIVVDVELDFEGRIASLPLLVSPDKATSKDRRLYANVLLALETCGPFGLESEGKLRLAASDSEIQVLDHADAAWVPSTRSSRANAGSPPLRLAPSTAWKPANRETDSELSLSRGEVANLQARLTVLGFNPIDIDGIAGYRTRAAISDWQKGAGIPSTGYLDKPQIAELRRQSESGFVTWIEDGSNRAKLEQASIAINARRASGKKVRAKLEPGYFWFKGRMCRRVIGNLIYSCK